MAKPKGKTEIVMLPVNQIHPNTFGMRETIDKEKIHELGKSIDEEGQLQSILVRPDPNQSGYEIIAGERRWLAHKDAGIPEIASVVRDVPDDLEAVELSLAENLHRADLTPQETEKFLGQLWDTSNPETLRKDGKKLGKQARYQLMSELARRIGMPELQVSRILHARKERSQLPDNLMKETTYRELEVTRSLEDTPEIRNQILEMKLRNEDLVNLVKILKTTKEQSPELAQQAVALVKSGRSVQDVQRVTALVAGTAPEVTRYVIQMSQDGQPMGEIEKFIMVVKDQSPELQQHAINLMQKKSQPVEDVKRQIEFLKDASEDVRQEVILNTEDIPVPAPVQLMTPFEIIDEDVVQWKKGEQELDE